MKKKNFKRCHAAVLALCVLLLLCGGCGKDAGKENAEGGEKTEAQATDGGAQTGQTSEDAQAQGNPAADPAETAAAETPATETPAVKAPPVIRTETVPCTSEYMESLNFTASYDKFSVEGDGYEALKEAIANLNEDIENSVYMVLEDYVYTVASMWEDAEAGTYDNMNFWLNYTASVVYADAQVVSLSYDTSAYLGGAHPYDYSVSYNLNAATGDELSLRDITEDDNAYDELCGELIAVLKQFSESSPDNQLNDDYADTVSSYFYGEYDPTWYYVENALLFHFNPYALAPYASGPIEAEVPLDQIRLAKLSTEEPKDPLEVHVATVDELYGAIDSNVRIYLAPGVYDLTEWIYQSEEEFSNPRVDIDWGTFRISGVSNLELIAEKPRLTTQIVTQNSTSDVLTFERCRNVVLDGLTLGHAVTPGTCTGDVLEFDRCKHITLRSMNLYGCGTYGITAYNCKGLEMTESLIHDCTYGILFTSGCEDFHFQDSMFIYCKEYTLLDGGGSDLEFENCIFDKNEGQFLSNPEYYEGEPTQYVFRNCQFLSGEDADFARYSGNLTVTQD